MSKVIDYNRTWYKEVAPRSFYDENDLENAIIQNLKIIFPNFHPLLFKQKVFDTIRAQNGIPDLAMVKDDYSEWYIIEVELGKHDKVHVIDQIQTFYNCVYTEVNANYMSTKNPNLDKAKLKAMVNTHLPNFMVIVNEEKKDWIPELKRLRCKTCVFQIYQDFKGNPIYRLSGEYPVIVTDFCHCKYQKGLTYAVEILDTQFLDGFGIVNGNSIQIEYNNLSFLWERMDAGKRIFLNCNSSVPPLDPLSDRYRLNYLQRVKPTLKASMWERMKNFFKPTVKESQQNYSFSFTKD